jgi:hypothetical protein
MRLKVLELENNVKQEKDVFYNDCFLFVHFVRLDKERPTLRTHHDFCTLTPGGGGGGGLKKNLNFF